MTSSNTDLYVPDNIQDRIVSRLADLNAYHFNRAIRQGKIALLAYAVGMRSRDLIRRVRVQRGIRFGLAGPEPVDYSEG